MEMAQYILQIFQTRFIVVHSWGFNSPIAIENGLRFRVQGFKFCGIVEGKYDEGSDLFNVSFIKCGEVVKTVNGVFFDSLVEVIDNTVEKTSDYDQRVKEEYSL